MEPAFNGSRIWEVGNSGNYQYHPVARLHTPLIWKLWHGMDQEKIWSERYRAVGDDYLFGTAPNRFLAHRAQLFRPGMTALAVADGEGRNSVWLAELGLQTTAVEISAPALAKARRLAAARQVTVRFLLADMLADDWPPVELVETFDWVVAIFVQFVGPTERPRQFDSLRRLVRPGGRLLLQGYTPRQIDYRSGGPSAVDNLYTPDLLRGAFADWQIEDLVEYEDEICEGLGHCGRSALIGLVVRKPDRRTVSGSLSDLGSGKP